MRGFVVGHFHSFWVESRCPDQFRPSISSCCCCAGSSPANSSASRIHTSIHHKRVVSHSVVFQAALRLHGRSQTFPPLETLIQASTWEIHRWEWQRIISISHIIRIDNVFLFFFGVNYGPKYIYDRVVHMNLMQQSRFYLLISLWTIFWTSNRIFTFICN